jgi:hypothetical protein
VTVTTRAYISVVAMRGDRSQGGEGERPLCSSDAGDQNRMPALVKYKYKQGDSGLVSLPGTSGLRALVSARITGVITNVLNVAEMGTLS